MYIQLNTYSFVNNYNLAQLAAQLPNSTAHYSGGTTLVTIPNAPAPVPLKLLCDRIVNLTRDRSEWNQVHEAAAGIVGQQIGAFYRKGYEESLKRLPCCFAWLCGFSCCDWPSSSISEAIELGNILPDMAEDEL